MTRGEALLCDGPCVDPREGHSAHCTAFNVQLVRRVEQALEEAARRCSHCGMALDTVCERHPGWKLVWCNACVREDREFHARGGGHRWPDR